MLTQVCFIYVMKNDSASDFLPPAQCLSGGNIPVTCPPLQGGSQQCLHPGRHPLSCSRTLQQGERFAVTGGLNLAGPDGTVYLLKKGGVQTILLYNE